jgi:hypothetical protein
MARLFGLVALASAIAAAAAVSARPALAQQAAITNIDIEMSRNSRKGPFGVRAEVTNPNEFAVKDIHVHCTIVDGRGNKLKAYDSTILAIFPAKQKIVVPRLDVGAWPDQAIRASCTSSSAERI